ncbi:MAG: hypothetical protein EKK41_27595 [Hyphomicrobiales bacterium]|nr:MAG: hypothetical protein EKK41_27595 [Hyphomicrobiales bacterium]
MLQDADKAAEAILGARDAIKMEMWGEALRRLNEAQEKLTVLLREAGEKSRAVMQAPKGDTADRE